MNQIEKIIDIATWNRKEHFEHFSAFDDPFFGVTVNVDCTVRIRKPKTKVCLSPSWSCIGLLPLPPKSKSSVIVSKETE